MSRSPILYEGENAMPIPGFDGYYATDSGRILSEKASPLRPLKPALRKYDQRKRYSLTSDSGKIVCRYGSYWILNAFVGPRPVGKEACHNNGDCTDDSAENLRWDTRASNIADKHRHGTVPRGEAHWKAKLTDGQIDQILCLLGLGFSMTPIAKEFGVTVQRIYQIGKAGGR